MYKVLIVDDESWVIESLKASVEWEANGFEVTGQAENGSEALEFIRREMPDVVFVDIRMPGMTGLEVIKRGGELRQAIRFIVVSGYAEFAYAQKALNYGAVAYCLKPYDEDEILSVLKKLKKQLDASRQTSDLALIQLLEEQSEENRLRLKQELAKCGIAGDADTSELTAIVAAGSSQPPIVSPEGALAIRIGKIKMLYVVKTGTEKALVAELERQLGTPLRGIGVSEPFVGLAAVNSAVLSASQLADHYFISGGPGVFFAQSVQQAALNEAIKKIDAAIRNKEISAVNRHFEAIGAMFRQGELTIRQALHVYNMMMSFLYRLGYEQGDNLLYSSELLIETFGTVQDMIAYLESLTIRSFRSGAEFSSEETSNETFKSLFQYVNEHFREDLSIQELSQKFYINPGYLSQLFKREVGEPFTAYIAKQRIAYACELLERTNMMIGEIAEISGYPDYFYFTRTFKKLTGQTPTQFRSKQSDLSKQ
ncbi:response regulator [Paenibacillus sp. MBLB4367]|uniref:response regulator transcription factor n=1 Tax=Paenibacillus sp. MBLB4367 TaxID=3384767 RepID=UPI0039083C9A